MRESRKESVMKVGLTILRAILGLVFIGHGTQKLFGWFEGEGLSDTGDSFDEIGLRPGAQQATTAGISETVGGALIATGFLMPVGCGTLVHGRRLGCCPQRLLPTPSSPA
jgi:putative oxidoreductase